MKASTSGLLALALLAQGISAHYTFSILLVNKTASDQWEYIRDVGNGFLGHRDDPQYPDIVPTKNFTCGVDAWKANRNQTLTADVVAGSEIGIRMTPYQTDWVFHIGPAQVYLAKAPSDIDDLSSWDPTNADWFKIATAGAVDDTHWYLTGFKRKDWNFTIPASTPPGKYMLRHEQIWPQELPTPTSGPGGINISGSQFYINCAQINIIGPGGGKPGPTVKFPGAYKIDDPGVSIPDGIAYYDEEKQEMFWTTGFLNYTAPGPAIWSG